ncbi:phosphoribosylanthranilate isomerase [Ferrovibrio sp.]|uniref:phosphoribosylanthranilate isomerase n=1 Tax=Ferrovibrio sp. TaxID=1917215 RepID=UPI00311D6432
MIRLKVCCIATPDEARLAIAHGASALGLVAEMPSGPGVIGDDAIAEIAAMVPPPVATFLLTSRHDGEAIVEHLRLCGTNTVQLVDYVPVAAYAVIRRALPSVRIVQVVHVEDEDSAAFALDRARHVDALLLDSGNTKLAVKELGGTGRTHDWGLSRRIVAECGRPVFLAGGIRPDNVAGAVAAVQPFGIDLCSGVRTGGRLDAGKLAALAAELRRV